jgi:hypothetical protein
MKHKAANVLGWIGVSFILAAYALNNFQILSTETDIYRLLNLVGSIAIIIETVSKKDWQPVVLNIVWALVALIGLLGII